MKLPCRLHRHLSHIYICLLSTFTLGGARITRIFKTPWSKIMFFRGVNISCFIYTYMEHGVKYLFCVMYCRSLFVPLIFCFVHCAVYPSSINGFWIPLWYLQATDPYQRKEQQKQNKKHKKYLQNYCVLNFLRLAWVLHVLNDWVPCFRLLA
jgi:hypothetical protein